MPTLSIVAVFVSKQDWCMMEFADHTRSKPIIITVGEAFVKLAEDMDASAWLAFREALKNQGNWIVV